MLIFKEIIYQGVNAGQLPARTNAAREWYRDAAEQISAPNRLTPSKVVRSFEKKRKVGTLTPGYMYLFKYDPKGKADLPYYDTFPLIFPIETYPDGFLGINFHYLPHPLRAKLMDAIYSTTTDRNYDEKTRVQISYSILAKAAKYRAFKPTVKRYLNRQVRSPFLEITSIEWDIALFLPLEKFRKSSKETIWTDSRRMVR
jgi:hypothetical protein